MSDLIPVITDSNGNTYHLVEFFNHDSQQYLYALELVEPSPPPGGEG